MPPLRFLIAGLACATTLAVGASSGTTVPEVINNAAAADQRVSLGESGCTRSARTIRVSLTRYPSISRHVRKAIADGQPVILHIDRAHADERRGAATDDLPTRPGYDRDEYPPAMTREGGESADVRHVRSSENRAAGASMGAQLRRYCNGQAFRLTLAGAKRAPAPTPTVAPVIDPEPTVVPDAEPETPADAPVTEYANCDAVRAAGAAPLAAGEPGYSRKLDRDGDGVACES